MGLFTIWLDEDGADRDNGRDYSYIADIAGLISSNDEAVMKKINSCIESPSEYFASCAGRYAERGIDVNKRDKDTLYWIAMVDELEAAEYVLSVDYKEEPSQVLWTLESIKNYNIMIGSALSNIKLDDDDDVEAFGAKINAMLGKACVCWIEIDADCYELAIVTDEVYEKIAQIARDNGHSIVKF